VGEKKGKVGSTRQRITPQLLADLRANPPESLTYFWDTDVPGFAVRVSPLGTVAYYVAVDRKRRHALKVGKSVTIAQAREAARAKLAGITTGDVDTTPRRNIPKLSDYREQRFDDEYRASHRTDRGLSHLAPLMTKFGSVRLDEITHDVIERWRTTRRKGGAAPATINRNIAALKALLAHAVRTGVIKYSPLAGIKRLKVEDAHRIRYLEGDEATRLRKALDTREERIRAERDSANAWRAERGYQPLPDLRTPPYVDHVKPMVLLTLATGARFGEMTKLQWQFARDDTVTFSGDTTKSQRTRHVPLVGEAKEVLDSWRAQCGSPKTGYVFAGRDGKPRDNIKRAWHAVLADAGITNFRWHDMRHDFASRLVQRGVPLNTVRELLGHSDIKLTLIYSHLAPSHLRDAMELLNS
jgi:integrase